MRPRWTSFWRPKSMCTYHPFEFFNFSCGSFMSVHDTVCYRCVDVDSEKFRPVYLFNEKLVHLVDDIFWLMSFRSAEQAEKVLV